MLLAFDAEYVCLWLDERFSNGGIRRHDVHGSNVIFKGKMGKNLGRSCLCVERIILRPKRLNLKSTIRPVAV